MISDDFYGERDSRTCACVASGAFRNARLSLSISDAEAATVDGQAAFLLSANLLARWARVVTVSAPPVAVLPALASMLASGLGQLGPAAVELMKRADPFGLFSMGAFQVGPGIHIGRAPPPGTHGGSARGWLVRAGDAARTLETASTEPGFGALFLACIATAAAFRSALGEAVILETSLSLWNEAGEQGPPIRDLDLGRVLLPGFGAVGSAWAFLLTVFKAKAHVDVVDKDAVAISNLNRSPMFFFEHVGMKKVEVAAEFLRRHGVGARCFTRWLHEAIADGDLGARYDLVVPAANEYGARLVVQNLVPPLQVYGTTGRDWQAFSGRHIPLRDDCLVCRFPDKGKQVGPAMACSTSAIPVGAAEETVSENAALPFLSVAAAVMAFAETAKLILGKTDTPNFSCFDFQGSMQSFFTETRTAVPGCICNAQRAVWRALNGGTRFANLSA